MVGGDLVRSSVLSVDLGVSGQYTPILTGLRALVTDRELKVEVVPLVVGQRSVQEKEWLETLGIFGIGKENGKRIIDRLGRTLLDEHEKHFGNYCTLSLCQTLGVLVPRTTQCIRDV